MRILQLLAVTAAALVLALPPAPAAAAPSLADSLIPAYATATDPARMETLLRLQLAAARWRDAEATIDRLAQAYRTGRPGREAALIPWRLYARAKAYETLGSSPNQALKRAFDGVIGGLSNDQLGVAYGWFNPSFDRLREVQESAFQACGGKPVDACDHAAELVAARQSLLAWSYLLPSI